MTLPSTGKISLGDINVELQLVRTAPISLGNAAVRALAGKPTGQVKLSDLRGKTYVPPSGDAIFQLVAAMMLATAEYEYLGYSRGASGSLSPSTWRGYNVVNIQMGKSIYEGLTSFYLQFLTNATNYGAIADIKRITMGGLTLPVSFSSVGDNKFGAYAQATPTLEQYNLIKAAVLGKTTNFMLHYT